MPVIASHLLPYLLLLAVDVHAGDRFDPCSLARDFVQTHCTRERGRDVTKSAFGETVVRTGSDPQPYGFAGEAFEAVAGLAYHRARWMDPTTGRFLGMDPEEPVEDDPLTGHRYGYAAQSPVSQVDPTGRFFTSIADLGAATTIAVALNNVTLTFGSAVMDQIQYGGYAGLRSLGIGLIATAAIVVVPTGLSSLLRKFSTPSFGLGFQSFKAFKNAMGAAGANKEWHHIVGQTSKNVEKFGAQTIHNTRNLIPLDEGLHGQISAFYSTKQPFTNGLTVRDWIGLQSYDEQIEFGLEQIRRLSGTP